MSFGKEDKLVSVRFNSFEQKELEYVVSHYGRYCRMPTGAVIKDLVHNAYLNMKAKEKENEKKK